MQSPKSIALPSDNRAVKAELRLQGRGVSRGMAIGPAVSLFGSRRQFYKVLINPESIEDEVKRLRSAVSKASKEIAALSRRTRPDDTAGRGIFEAHRMILSDSSLITVIEEKIRRERVNAEWAAKAVADEKIASYKNIDDLNIREKYIDIDDVCERLLDILAGERSRKIKLVPGSILIAREVKPSTIIELASAEIGGLVAENGGWTSHTFILAREHGIPAVAGVANAIRKIKPDDEVMVDGFTGTVIVEPSEATQRSSVISGASASGSRERSVSSGSLKTLDGREIVLNVNLDAPERYKAAVELGAVGVGLYRSEYLFNKLNRFPTEAEQIKAYSKMAEAAGDAGVTIRTYDLGPADTDKFLGRRERNPALGLRGIRLALSEKKQLRTQIRALLRCAGAGKLSMVIPMISGIDEIRAVREIVGTESAKLRAKGITPAQLDLGAMIEIPSAVMMIETLLRQLDFISLGTNDLVQYLLGADRDNEGVAGYYRSLHPAVLKAVANVSDAAAEADKPLIVCGEMAGSPFYVPLLIGLGVTKFSINLNSLDPVARLVEGIAYEECIELVRLTRTCDATKEIENVVREFLTSKWSHLIAPDLLRPH